MKKSRGKIELWPAEHQRNPTPLELRFGMLREEVQSAVDHYEQRAFKRGGRHAARGYAVYPDDEMRELRIVPAEPEGYWVRLMSLRKGLMVEPFPVPARCLDAYLEWAGFGPDQPSGWVHSVVRPNLTWPWIDPARRKHIGDSSAARWMQESTGWRSVVYAIVTMDHRFVKIGYTRRLAKRFGDLVASNAMDLSVLSIFPGGEELEHKLHERFAMYRIHHEWFELNRKVKKHLLKRRARTWAKVVTPRPWWSPEPEKPNDQPAE